VDRESGRARAPFVVFDCATLSDDAARRTIFGERREDVSVPGWLELAADGTLVLEHVVALSPGLQAEIARALSERRARPVGAQTHYPVGARLVCTLRVAPIDLVASGALSAELSRWLEPTSYRVPPLRERAEDLESLILMAVDRAARVSGRQVPGLTPEVLNALREHVFLGNEQELESVVFRAVLACRGPRITLADLPPLASHSHASDGSFQEQEREILRRALERAQGNKTRAARALGLKRTTLIDKLRRLGLDDASQPLQH
jgi:DNA-binding NtrC family response regulator